MSVKIHFLNVGHGDCTFVEHDSGRLTMIDINNSKTLPATDEQALAEASGVPWAVFKGAGVAYGKLSWEDYYQSLLVDPYEYFEGRIEAAYVHRYVQTHPDLDHMSGLHRFFRQEAVPLLNMWDMDHEKEALDNVDWLTYELMRLGVTTEDAKHMVLRIMPSSEGNYWSDDGLTVLAPSEDLLKICNVIESWNDSSYVLRLEYGGRRVILPGDAETLAWNEIVDTYHSADLSCDILKAAHHGRENGYHERAVEKMSPDFVVCSVGKKPETDASDEYAKHGSTVLSTRFQGSITATLWYDGEVWIENHKGDRIGTLPPL